MTAQMAVYDLSNNNDTDVQSQRWQASVED